MAEFTRKSVIHGLISAWPLLATGVSLLVAGIVAASDVKNDVSKNTGDIKEAREVLKNKATQFLVDNEFERVWEQVKSNVFDLDKLQDKINDLDISDTRVRAKIEIEVEKLRNEIQKASAKQQEALYEQRNLMQQILTEIQKQ